MAGLAFRAGTVAVRNLSIACSSSNPWAELVAFQFAESDNKITSARSLGDAHFLWESLPVKWLADSGLHISDPSAHSKEDTWQANSDKKDEIINTTYRELLFFLFCLYSFYSQRDRNGGPRCLFTGIWTDLSDSEYIDMVPFWKWEVRNYTITTYA